MANMTEQEKIDLQTTMDFYRTEDYFKDWDDQKLIELIKPSPEKQAKRQAQRQAREAKKAQPQAKRRTTAKEALENYNYYYPEFTKGKTDEEILKHLVKKNPDVEIVYPKTGTERLQAGLSGAGALADPLLQMDPRKKVPQIAQDPDALKKLGIGTLTAAQIAGQFLPYGISGLTTTPATQYGISKLKGRSTGDAATQALIAGGSDLGLSILLGIPPAVKTLSRGFARHAVGMPYKESAKAIRQLSKDKNVLKGAFSAKGAFAKLTNKAKKGLSVLRKEAGEEVKKFTPLLRESKVKVSTEPLIKKIQQEVAEKTYLGETRLTNMDLKQIDIFLKRLDKAQDLGSIQMIKGQAQDLAKYPTDILEKNITPVGNTIIKKIAQGARELIEKNAPKEFKDALLAANRKFSDVSKIYDELTPGFVSKKPTAILKLCHD